MFMTQQQSDDLANAAKAVDWSKFWTLFQTLMPIILALFTKTVPPVNVP